MTTGTRSAGSIRDSLLWALEQTLGAGRSGLEMVEFACQVLGRRVLPEIEHLVTEVRSGRIPVKGLGEGAREILFGAPVAPEERERMIRETAYYRAQRRGAEPSDPEADWLEAEREVDARLAANAGLVARAREASRTAAASTGREAVELRESVGRWLGHSGRDPGRQG